MWECVSDSRMPDGTRAFTFGLQLHASFIIFEKETASIDISCGRSFGDAGIYFWLVFVIFNLAVVLATLSYNL